MKVTGLIFVLLGFGVYVSCHPRQKSSQWLPGRSYYSNRRATPPGLTWDGRPCPVAGGCIQLPRQEDVLTRYMFETQVAGRAYDALYIIGKGMPVPSFYRQQTRYTVKGDFVKQDFRVRLNKFKCIVLPEYQYATFTSKTHAIMYNPAAIYLKPTGLVSPTSFFISADPSQYIILLTCHDRWTVRKGFCNGRYDVEIAVTQGPPNIPPLKLIAKDLWTKLGLSLKDPGSEFHYIGEGCGLRSKSKIPHK